MEKTRVPRSLFVFIILILGAMYYYAAYVDSPDPEQTVENFYQAYFSHDYDTMAENLSVFWSVNFLPQYQTLTPAQLLEKRDAIEKETSAMLAKLEEQTTIPSGIDMEFLPSYTQVGEKSAVTAYEFKQNGESMGMELAILIKEDNQLRIINTMPVNKETLEQIKTSDISDLDSSFEQLLNAK